MAERNEVRKPEYIEREALFEAVKDKSMTQFDWSEKVDLEEFEEVLANIPTADVAEVRRGKWIRPTKYSQDICNQCGLTPKMIFGILPNFCPNCGADMRGNNDDSRTEN